ncbi:phosphatidate cytidylyltransferase [Actibacterium mucosum KCTC 23349]|uniref:Phosphatidate cytidylyltransferase n=1 Tax=Actibacterium mucosum KCTC 23349 TaxID=1454373 RepID=A0A037ZLA6_9RHOB|nr:UDP-2,3-diacylglucosamine diphosphatase LpxI [Actibacterium mucosum]KAJ56869.1 phosphatidate cytidylyltransferase [Actibacterium mucosum KCTC 23349]
MSVTAIIAGAGRLPGLLVKALRANDAPVMVAAIAGTGAEDPGGVAFMPFHVERMAVLFDELTNRDVTRVVFAGGMSRPALDPALLDPGTAALLPRILPALQQGDDGLLRAVIEIFEDRGFEVMGAADIAPALCPGEGVLTQSAPSEQDQADADRAATILSTLGPLDLGQGAVVAQGLCLAIETLPGTDAMLKFAADYPRRPDPNGARGVFVKAPKPGQDLRVDMPVIGPATVAAAVKAGLAGIAFQAGGVMMLEQAETVAAADAAGLFLWSRAL